MHHTVQVQDKDEAGLVKHGTQEVDHRIHATIQKGPHVSEDDPKFKSDIERASIISQLTFAYVGKVIKKAFSMRKRDEGFEDPDLTTFPYKRRGDVLEQKFKNHLAKQKAKHPNKVPSLSKAVVMCCWFDILRCLLVAIVFSFLRVFIGYIVKKLIDSYDGPRGESYKYSGGLSGALIIGFFLEHHYNHIGTYFPIHIRGGLVSLIYDKTTKLSLYTLTKVSPGQVINLASNDVNVFDEFGVYFPKLLTAPFLLIASGALLWIWWGVLCLVGLGYILIWFPFQGIYIVKTNKHTEEKNRLSDDRVKLTSESIEGIRLLKMYAWEIRFKSRIYDVRNKETGLLKKELLGESFFRSISFSSLGIATYLIFMPSVLVGNPITPGIVFATYYLFAFIRLYGAFFVNQGLLFLVQATTVLKKIERILDVPEMGEVTFEQPKDKDNAIEFDDYTGYWTKSEGDTNGHTKISIPTMQNEAEQAEAPDLPTLSNITVNIKRKSLNALVGTVGSGKTSFLMSLTGEFPKTTGSLRYKGSIAYIEQEPTIFAGTFRDSICFGKPYDPEFYAKVIKACCLETDLSLFPKGDMSEIGEKGNNLSGGQKARLALARGVYADADIYLLDDPLSAVDPKVAKLLFEGCISGILKNKTRILVTHQVDFAKNCDHVMMIEDGRIIGSGPFHGIKDHDLPEHPREIERRRTMKLEGKEEPPSLKKQPSRQGSALVRLQSTLHRHASDHQETINTAKKQEEAPPAEEKIEQTHEKDPYPGKVDVKSVLNLLKFMGNPLYVFTIFALYVMVEMNNIAYGILLGKWIEGTYDRNDSLGILGGLVGFYIFIYLLKYIFLNIGLVRTTKKHHEKMLDRVIRAPVYFFDSNSVGLILNRFSNDIGTLDRFLPLITMDVLDNVCFILSVVITVSVIDPVHLAPLAGEIIFIFFALWFCFQGVKLTKKYELSTKGPLFGLFGSSLSGIVIIRSYGNSEYFKEKFKHQLHSSLKGSIGFALTARFLAFYTDFGYNLAEIAVIFIITARNQPDTSASLNGLVLALIISVSGAFQYTLRQICMANILFESSARIQAYWTLPQEPELELPKDKELQQRKWPEKGDIVFNKVYMKYSPTGPHVIHNLTLHADAGKRIGCVGRTGAGKTSILQLLFRLQGVDKEKEPEGYIKIDDVDINEVGLHELRENISIIPQMPFILTGTVRYNVDPLGKATDEEIWQVLQDVQLREHVERLPKKLDTPMTAATSVFSVGQKQLVCLGRSILKPANIMIMDEATANMDLETDNYVTNKIRNVFTNSTTFTIAHRLSTIANYDKVLVLDKGQIKEFDEPYKLLVKNIGDNDLTNEQGHFTSMVNNTGPATSKHIFEIAQTAYYERHPEAKKPAGGLVKDRKKGGEDDALGADIGGQPGGVSGTAGATGAIGEGMEVPKGNEKGSSFTGVEAIGRQDQDPNVKDRETEREKQRRQEYAQNKQVSTDDVELGNVDDVTPFSKQSVAPYDFHAGSSSKF